MKKILIIFLLISLINTQNIIEYYETNICIFNCINIDTYNKSDNYMLVLMETLHFNCKSCNEYKKLPYYISYKYLLNEKYFPYVLKHNPSIV